ncbi:MAG: HEPN domain-containing protein, partial [Deltaproteobacteria bacterium]|nr:HEPN domain-containing protein [Deltaproteobacteria bacterium]
AKEMAVGFLRQAERRQKSAKAALEESDFAYVVRQCQEGIELALKAVLIYTGIDFPKWHDVGPILIREKELLKFWSEEILQKFASYSRQLTNDRARSMYGDEDLLLAPENLFFRHDAGEALANLGEILEKVKEII